MTALGRKMQARGHEVIFFGLPDAARIVHNAGLDFVPFGEDEYPVGSTPAMYPHLAMLKGEDVVRYSFQEMHPQRTRITLEQLPEKLIHTGVEALVLDTRTPDEIIVVRPERSAGALWRDLLLKPS
jgi:hypothetical protein